MPVHSIRARVADSLPPLTGDGWLLFATCAVRMFAYGSLSVVLGIYLAELGLPPSGIGLVFTSALVGGAIMTALLTGVADRVGRRGVLVAGGLLMALAGGAFALTSSPIVLAATAVVGTISPSGREVGPFLSVEQAMLPETTSGERRTATFAAYNVVGSLAGAFGALAAGLPALLGIDGLAGYRLLIWGYAAAGLVLAVLFARLGPSVEATPPAPEVATPAGGLRDSRTATKTGARPGTRQARLGTRECRGMVLTFGALFALDSFASGFVAQGWMAYWFGVRWGLDAAALGRVLFVTNLLAALSYVVAVRLSKRIGLLNTMVFTHLPANVLLMMVPFMPSLWLALAALFARHLLAQMDIPARQSYTMAIIGKEQRAAASGLWSVGRTSAAALAPPIVGMTLANPALGLPFLIAGGLKCAYDLALWALFRDVRPPEEEAARSKHQESRRKEAGGVDSVSSSPALVASGSTLAGPATPSTSSPSASSAASSSASVSSP